MSPRLVLTAPSSLRRHGPRLGASRPLALRALRTPDEKIKALPHEVLIVHGRDDRVIPVSGSIKLNQLIERSELHVFGQCGHWTQIEKKDRFNQLVENFLV